jgi:hypothetical protein
MICEAAKLYHQIQTIEPDSVPILIPTFNLVTYAKFMVDQLEERGLTNFIICDNKSTYQPMIDFLDSLSSDGKRVVRFDNNWGPRIFGESPEILSVLPEYFILTDPDLVFNSSLPKNFISKMKRIIDTYNVSKAGFAIDIFETKDKFFNHNQVHIWEGAYWTNEVKVYEEKDPVYSAPIDTTFCLFKKSRLIQELRANRNGLTGTSGVRIAGRFTCEHMGWWKDQPVPQEELDYYHEVQSWASTYNEKKRLGYV